MTDYASSAGFDPADPGPADAADTTPANVGDGGAPVERSLPSSMLLQGARCVQIVHNGAIYRLQATRLGKLILTK